MKMDLFLVEGPTLILWSDTRGGTNGPKLYVKQDAGSDVRGGQLKMKTCILCSVAQQLNIVLKSLLV
jgi:hypothetical protein